MSELTFDQRITAVEALLVKLARMLENNTTFDERKAVVEEIFDAIEDLKDRLDAMENAVYITEATLTDSTTRN